MEPRETARRLAGWALAGCAVLVATAAGLAVGVAEGEARGHVVFHLLFAAPVVALLAVLGLWWEPPARSGAAAWQLALLALLTVAALGAVLDAIGGAGYDRFNDGREREWLVTIHNVALLPALAIFPALAAGLATLLGIGAHRLAGTVRAGARRA